MAPDHSTQTNEFASGTSPIHPPPTQPSSSAQTQSQQGYYEPGQQQQGFQQPQPQGFQQYPRSYGQPFTPYSQQPQPEPQQQQPFSVQPGGQPMQQWTPPEAPQNKAWDYTRLGLHVLDAIFCIIGLALTFSLNVGSSIGYTVLFFSPVVSRSKFHIPNLGVLTELPQLILALIWDLAELATRWLRKFKSGIHPGAHVAISLLIWLGAAAVGGIEVIYAIAVDQTERNCYDSQTQRVYQCGTTFDGRKATFSALAAFTSLVWLCHFIFFIGACIDTAKRNAVAKRSIMVVSGGPPYWGPAAQGFQPMPQYYGQGQNITLQEQGNGKEAISTAQPVAGRYA
ncbi:hypothetical protein ACJ41O_015061 [Fusarium nematophilum]